MMTRALHFRFVELERFTKTRREDLKDVREEWLFYLKNFGKMKEEVRPVSQEKATDKLLEAARYAGMSPNDRNEYLQNMRNEFDIKTEKWYARQEGLEEGRAEVARNMKTLGIPDPQIVQCTGLTPEQVQAL